MNCIGKIDENKSMIEQIDEYSIPSASGIGTYDVKDLKPIDKEYIKGMACMIDCVDNFEPYIATGSETQDKIIKEYIENILGDVIESMLGELGMNLYSIMDNDEEYWEKSSDADE